jgi:hypothetical protein
MDFLILRVQSVLCMYLKIRFTTDSNPALPNMSDVVAIIGDTYPNEDSGDYAITGFRRLKVRHTARTPTPVATQVFIGASV